MSEKRGRRGEGSITERADGRFLVRVPLPFVGGKRRQRSAYAASYPEAKELLKTLRNGIKDPEPSKESTGKFLERWLEDVVRLTCRNSTHSIYGQIVRCHVLPTLGDVPLAKLTPMHIQELLSSMERGDQAPNRQDVRAWTAKWMSKNDASRSEAPPPPKTAKFPRSTRLRQMTLMVLKRAFKQAVKWEIIGKNPAAGVDGPRAVKKEMKTWSKEETRQFLDVAYKGSDPRWPTLFDVLVSTGLRVGEALGLEWADVDLNIGTMNIHQQLRELLGQIVGLEELKTKAAYRLIRLPARPLAALRALDAALKRKELATGVRRPSLVFTSKDPRRQGVEGPLAGALYKKSVWAHFKQITRKAGVPRIRVHDLRHTAATLMLEGGVKIKAISEQLGHANIVITLGTYAHVTPEMREAAVSVMDQALGDT